MISSTTHSKSKAKRNGTEKNKSFSVKKNYLKDIQRIVVSSARKCCSNKNSINSTLNEKVEDTFYKSMKLKLPATTKGKNTPNKSKSRKLSLQKISNENIGASMSLPKSGQESWQDLTPEQKVEKQSSITKKRKCSQYVFNMISSQKKVKGANDSLASMSMSLDCSQANVSGQLTLDKFSNQFEFNRLNEEMKVLKGKFQRLEFEQNQKDLNYISMKKQNQKDSRLKDITNQNRILKIESLQKSEMFDNTIINQHPMNENEHIGKLAYKYEGIISQYETMFKFYKKQLSDCQQKLEKSIKKNTKIQIENQKKQEELKQLKEKIYTINLSKSRQIQQVMNQFQSEKYKELKQLKQQVENEKQQKCLQLKQLKEKYDKLQGKKQKQIAQIKEKLLFYQAENKNLKIVAKQTQSSGFLQQNKLESEIQSLESKIHTLKIELQAKQTQILKMKKVGDEQFMGAKDDQKRQIFHVKQLLKETELREHQKQVQNIDYLKQIQDLKKTLQTKQQAQISLTNKVQGLKADLKTKQKDLQKHQKQKEVLQEQLIQQSTQTNKKIQQYLAQIQDLKTEYEIIARAHQLKNEKLTSTQAQNLNLKLVIKEIKEEVLQIREQLHENQNQKVQLKDSHVRYVKKIEQLNQVITEKTQIIDKRDILLKQLKEQKRQQSAQIEHIKHQNDKLVQQNQKVVEKYRLESQKEKNKFNQKFENTKAQIQTLRKQVAIKKELLKKSQSQQIEHKNTQTFLQSKLQRISELQSRVRLLRNQNQGQKQKYQSLEQQNTVLSSKITALQSQLSQITVKYQKIQISIKQLKAQKSIELNEKHQSWQFNQKHLIEEKENKINDLLSELRSAKQKIIQKDKYIEILQTKCKNNQSKINELQQEILQSKTLIDQLQRQIISQDKSSESTKMQSCRLEQQVKYLSMRQSANEKKIQQLENVISDLKQRIREKQMQNLKCQNQVELQKQIHTTLNHKIQSLKNQNSSIISTYNHQLQQRKEIIEDLMREKKKLYEKLNQ